MVPVLDLHCDLLSYLAKHPYNSAYDEPSRASIPQLRAGGVAIQVMAAFTATGASSVNTMAQEVKRYIKLKEQYPDAFTGDKAGIQTLFAIENASGLILEDEPLEKGIQRLQKINATCEKPLYITLTWHHENRFGGGNLSKKGLKQDGKTFLKKAALLFSAVDLSHTSDWLAHDILDFLEKEKLPLKVMCSHSNFRAVQNHARNLPDAIADEIVRRGGIIGMNLIHDFVGKGIENFVCHVAYGLKRGYENSLALGADFFCELSLPKEERERPHFFPGFDNASCYPKLLKMLEKEFGKKIAQKIAYGNAKKFCFPG